VDQQGDYPLLIFSLSTFPSCFAPPSLLFSLLFLPHLLALRSKFNGPSLITAFGAAGLGAKVALIEKNVLGGDCLNYGCVPSKTLIRASRAMVEIQVP